IVVNPTDPDTVYVAVSAQGINGVASANPGTGIWKSTNGGISWTNTTTRISTTQDYSDLALDPGNPQMLYAAVGTEYGSPANGVYKTTDGGTTWAIAGNIPKGNTTGNTKIAIAPSAPNTIYVSIAYPNVGSLNDGNLFRMMKSVDGGVTWK